MRQQSRIEQQLGLRQRLSPQQVQYVRLLEMTSAEVEEEVQRALDENPALMLAEPGDGGVEGYDESAEALQRADYAGDDDVPPWHGGAQGGGEESWQPVAADVDETLSDHLNQQLAESDLSADVRAVAQYIVGNIDDNGYLTRTLPQMADDLSMTLGRDVPAETLQLAYWAVRGLEPAGVGATDLRDCLLLQLDRKPELSEAEEDADAILRDHYDLFVRKHFDKIGAAMGLSTDRLRAALEVIRHLEPKPGAGVGYSATAEAATRIVPEFTVDVADGERLLVGLAWQPPELAIEPSFALGEMPEGQGERARQAYLFVKERHDEGAQLIRLLEMRSDTLTRVIGAVAALQREFFLSDDATQIRPMVLRDIAQLTGLDLSVISRATSGKYVQTRSGVYPMKMFFTEKPGDDAGEETSLHAVLHALREIIEGEDKRHPLADEALQQQLAQRGMAIARRTVTKYRERLGFPVARLRKEL